MGKYRKTYEIVGYAYDSELHCVKCAEKRFPEGYKNEYSYKKCLSLEGNGNNSEEIHPIFLGDEFVDAPPVCGDCFELLD